MQTARLSAVLLVAYLATGCARPGRWGATGQGGSEARIDAGRIDGSAGGSSGHAGMDGDAAIDGAKANDGAAAGVGGAGGMGPTACGDTAATQPASSCRSVAECGPIGPVKCCTGEPCWPASACPIPPSLCPSSATRLKCSGNQDCNPGGTCVFTVSGCPQCQYSACQYPPPPCTQSPDSCAPWGRCQPDAGTCAPILCTDGYACGAGSRCAVASARANANGCEQIPCDSGWTCTTNTRCTAPSDPASHGCTPLNCKTDGDCDCGYCVNGTCASNLGKCSFPPQ